MGQTLTHGVYLPDEGERNCYSGLAANWQILDSAVGTVAEHTSALSGKAPLVHTHGKADITDLFNSANTWTENNTFSKQVCLTKVNDTSLKSQNSRAELGETNLSGDTYTQISFEDKNGDNFGYLRQVYGADGNNGFHFFVRNKFLNGVPDTTGTVDYSYFGLRLNPDKSKEAVFKASLRPYDSINSYNLGDATYQWSNLYAKNYYYNGVAWGLDKVNTWTAQQKIVGNNSRGTVSIYNPAYTKGSALSSTDLSIGSIYMGDGGQQGLANSLTFISADLAANGAKTLLSLSAMENTASSGTRTNVVIQYDKNDAENPKKVSVGGTVLPSADATFSLGTPSFKWKTLNGINPGALSLLDYNNVLDVTSEIPIASLDGNTQININDYLADKTGWLSIVIDDTAGNSIIVTQGKSGGSTAFNNSRTFHTGAQSNGYISVFFPIIAGTSKIAFIKAASLIQMRFYYCIGNV